MWEQPVLVDIAFEKKLLKLSAEHLSLGRLTNSDEFSMKCRKDIFSKRLNCDNENITYKETFL